MFAGLIVGIVLFVPFCSAELIRIFLLPDGWRELFSNANNGSNGGFDEVSGTPIITGGVIPVDVFGFGQ